MASLDNILKQKSRSPKKASKMTAVESEESSQLSAVSFEQLLHVKSQIGSKSFNQVLGASCSSTRSPGNIKSSEQSDRSRPMEVSSKKRSSVFRHVVPVKKKLSRDPRFDDLSGEFDESLFNRAYSFLGNIKKAEEKELSAAIRSEEDHEKKEQLQKLLNKRKQEEDTAKAKAKRRELEKEVKRKETELVRQGKKPFFLKKSDIRKLELAEKYDKLKKEGNLESFLKKRRKKIASKERPNIPKRHKK